MSSYVEQATLVAVDRASGPIKKVDAALQALMRTARSAERSLAGASNVGRYGALATQLSAAERAMRGVDRAQRSLATGSRMDVFAVAANNATRARDAMAGFHRELQRVGQTAGRNGLGSALAGGALSASQIRAAQRGTDQIARAQERERARSRRHRRDDYIPDDVEFLARHAAAAAGFPYHGAAALVTGADVARRYPVAASTILGGAAAAMAVKSTLHSAGERDLVTKQLDALGFGQKGHDGKSYIDHARHVANDLSKKYINVSETEVLESVKDATSIFGDREHAIDGVRHMARMTSFLKSYGANGDAETWRREVFAAIKSSEIAGRTTPEEMDKYFGNLTALKAVYGDNANFQQYLLAQRAAGAAGMGWNDEFRFGIMPALVQEFGSGAGVQMATAFRHMIGGKKYTVRELAMMSKYGVLDASGDKVTDDVRNSFKLNPFEAAMRLGEKIAKTEKFGALRDGDGNVNKDVLDKIKPILPELLGRMMGDRNAAKSFVEQLFQSPKLLKDAKLWHDVAADMDRIGKGVFFQSKTWPGVLAAIEAQKQNLLSKWGESASGPMISAGNFAAKGLNALSDFAEKHPITATGGIVGGAAAAGYASLKLIERMTGAAEMKAAGGILSSAGSKLLAAAAALQGRAAGGLIPGAGGVGPAGGGTWRDRWNGLGTVGKVVAVGAGVSGVFAGAEEFSRRNYASAAAEVGLAVASLFSAPALVATVASSIARAIEAAQLAANKQASDEARLLDAVRSGDVSKLSPVERKTIEEVRRLEQEAQRKRDAALSDPASTAKREEAKKAYDKAAEAAQANADAIKKAERPLTSDRKAEEAERASPKSIFQWLHDFVFPRAYGSELPPGATPEGPTGGAIPEAGGGGDLRAILSDSVFSISSAMESAGGAVEGAAGELAGALSMASGGVAEAGGSLVGAINSLAGQIGAISIPSPSVSTPTNTGSNAGIVR